MENDCIELPEVDLDEDDAPEPDEATEGKEKLEDPWREEGCNGVLERYGFVGRRGVAGAVGGGVGTSTFSEMENT